MDSEFLERHGTIREFIRQTTILMPVKAKYFAGWYGLSKRQLRKIIAEMREDGELVVGNCYLGYFMAKGWQEYEESVQPQVQNCYTYLKQFNKLKKIYTGRHDEQLALELNIYDENKRRVRMEKKRFTYQKKSNGEIGEKDVLILRETATTIEGIDMKRLNADERRSLEEANDTIIRLTKDNYRCYLKENIKEE